MGKKKKTRITSSPVDLQIKVDTVLTASVKKISVSASWSKSAADHDSGQRLRWQRDSYKLADIDNLDTEPTWSGKKAPAHTAVNVATDKSEITFIENNITNFYPGAMDTSASTYPAAIADPLSWIHVEVVGRAKKKTGQKSVVTYTWSAPAIRSVHIVHPPEPEIADEISAGDTDFSKRFSWTVPESTVWIGKDYQEKLTKKQKKKQKRAKWKTPKCGNDDELIEIFYDTEWQSILINNLTTPNFDPIESENSWNENASGWQTGATTAGQTNCNQTITESNQSWTGNYSYTRHFRVRSRGPGGPSNWDYSEYTYYNAPAPDAPKSVKIDGEGNVTVSNDGAVDSVNFQSKYMSYQYLVDVPETTISGGKVTISPPVDSQSWVEAVRVPTGTAATFPTIQPVPDKLVWMRIVFVGTDDSQRAGDAVRAQSSFAAALRPPTGLTISDIVVSEGRMNVSATNNSQVPSSYLIVYCKKGNETNPPKIGLIPHGETQGVTVQLPNDYDVESTEIGVQAVLGDYSYDSGSGIYTVTKEYMKSDIVWDGGKLPAPPTDLKLTTTSTLGTILATWKWNWQDSNVAEISWSDTEEAWESTSQPSSYTITNTHTGKWYISGLSVGTWYVRVRLGRTEGDVTTWTTYATTDPIKIVSVPERPYLMITPRTVTPDKSIKLSWVYSSEDGAPLKQVYIAKSNDLKTPIVKTNKSTVTLSQKDLKWEDGNEYELRICTESAENKVSEWSKVDEYSTFRVVALPSRPTVQFISGWVQSQPVTVGTSTHNESCLVSLPFEFNIGGIDSDNTVNVQIRRESNNVVKKPDENEYPVYADDVVYLKSGLKGPSNIEITQKDLIGDLDDNKYYRLIIDNTDEYGQTHAGDPVEYRFRVVWNHKAVDPTAEITIDRDNDVAFIKPIMPISGYLAGDVCDIYRLSADKPELIIEDGAFGTAYVDEYPTIGEFGGYKAVYRTVNGDIRNDSGGYAETLYEGEDYALTEFKSIIDFGKDSVTLRYNLSLSNSWSKDFTETKYLGGAIQGDWNPAVSRTGSLKATVSIQEDPMMEDPAETIEAMRRLAVYSGICHVRTPDGSGYYANVDVQEDREEKMVTKIAKFSLNITRVDPPEVKYTMRTKDEWEADQDSE